MNTLHARLIADYCKRSELEAMLLDERLAYFAMHEAEKVMNNEQWYEYIRLLCGESKSDDWPTCFLNLDAIRIALEQNAFDKAEAFLKTIGKYQNE